MTGTAANAGRPAGNASGDAERAILDSCCSQSSTFVCARVSRLSAELPPLLTVDETASLLRTTRKGIYAMVERGQLPGVTRIGRRVLIRSDTLLGWLRQKSTPSSDTQTSHPAAENLTRHGRSRK